MDELFHDLGFDRILRTENGGMNDLESIYNNIYHKILAAS